MTTKEFISIGNKLAESFSGLNVKKQLVFFSPQKGVLQGVFFEASSFDKKTFYIYVFVLPLCVPTTRLYFNFGMRLRNMNSDRWNVDSPELHDDILNAFKAEGLPFLSGADTLVGFIETAKKFSAKNPRTLEAIAYALFRVGEPDQADNILTKLIQQIDVKIPWQREIYDRAILLKDKFEIGSNEVQKTLSAWESQTSQNLKLTN